LRVEASAELSKTFYISYQQNEEFQRFQENIKHCMSSPSGYVLSPHMSLLYKEFMDDKYSNLLSGEVVDLYAIQIDEICVVSTPNSFKSIEDIPKWEIQHYIKLNS
jgi:hypothetical protein